METGCSGPAADPTNNAQTTAPAMPPPIEARHHRKYIKMSINSYYGVLRAHLGHLAAQGIARVAVQSLAYVLFLGQPGRLEQDLEDSAQSTRFRMQGPSSADPVERSTNCRWRSSSSYCWGAVSVAFCNISFHTTQGAWGTRTAQELLVRQ